MANAIQYSQKNFNTMDRMMIRQFLIIFSTINLLCSQQAWTNEPWGGIDSLLTRLQNGNEPEAYRAAADLTKLTDYHKKAEQVAFSLAIDPSTLEGTRHFLFRAYGNQLRLGENVDEGIKKLVPLIGKFGAFTDPVLESMVDIGPKALPHLVTLLQCETTTSASQPIDLSDPEQSLTITLQNQAAGALLAIASIYPNALEINHIAPQLVDCLGCTPRLTATLCGKVLSCVQDFPPELIDRLLQILHQSKDVTIKSFSAQLLASHHKSDSQVKSKLEEALSSADVDVQLASAIALYRYLNRHPKATTILESLSKSSNESHSTAALQVLGEK